MSPGDAYMETALRAHREDPHFLSAHQTPRLPLGLFIPVVSKSSQSLQEVQCPHIMDEKAEAQGEKFICLGPHCGSSEIHSTSA